MLWILYFAILVALGFVISYIADRAGWARTPTILLLVAAGLAAGLTIPALLGLR